MPVATADSVNDGGLGGKIDISTQAFNAKCENIGTWRWRSGACGYKRPWLGKALFEVENSFNGL